MILELLGVCIDYVRDPVRWEFRPKINRSGREEKEIEEDIFN